MIVILLVFWSLLQILISNTNRICPRKDFSCLEDCTRNVHHWQSTNTCVYILDVDSWQFFLYQIVILKPILLIKKTISIHHIHLTISCESLSEWFYNNLTTYSSIQGVLHKLALNNEFYIILNGRTCIYYDFCWCWS